MTIPSATAWRLSKTIVLICTFALLSLLPGKGFAQQEKSQFSSTDNSLPNAPMPQEAASSQTSADEQRTASIAGTVFDSTGAAIPNAIVSLKPKDGTELQTLRPDANGRFNFTGIHAGSYRMTVEAAGFAPFTTADFTVTAGQVYQVPQISLSVAASTTSIVVRPTEVIAAEQIKAEEKQRFIGVFPNFYVSYVPNPAPLTSKQKLSLASHDTFDWTSFPGISIGAAIQQATNAHRGYGQGAAGYGKRWGALFADGRISDLLSHYAFASLFHQDPRYFYQGTGTPRSRFFHAISNGFYARSDSGKIMFNYSYLLGDLCAGAISNAYYPPEDRGAGLVFTNAALGIAGRSMQGVFQEFVAKRLTRHAPDSKQDQSNTPSNPQRK